MLILNETTTDQKLVLCDDQSKPTLLLLGLLACEVAFDIAVGYAAYKFFSSRKQR